MKYTVGESKEIINYWIQQPAHIGYKNAKSLIDQKYQTLLSIIAVHRKEINTYVHIKQADGAANTETP